MNTNNTWILVVDDDSTSRDLLARRLERSGFTVAQAADGHETLDLIGRSWYDLVLLDHMMPGISGLQVLERLRRTHTASDLPVIMITAITDPSNIVASLKAGANDYIAKPIDFPVVLARVEVQLDRKRAEEALRRSQNRNRAILESALDGILIVDNEGVVVDANAASEEILGFPPGYVAGRSLGDLVIGLPGSGGDSLRSFLFDGQVSPLGQRIEVVVRRKGADDFPAEISVVRIPESEPWMFAMFLRDLTRRKQGESQLKSAQEDLEKRLQERTAELMRINESLQGEILERQRAEEDLLKARDAAMAAVAQNAGFLDKMGQEIGSLLYAIMDAGQFAEASSGAQREDMSAALQSAASLQLLLTDLREAQRAGSGIPDQSLEDLNLPETLEQIRKRHAQQAAGRRVSLRCEFGSNLPRWVRADAWLLRQVVSAMLSMAVDFTAEGEVALHAALEAMDANSAHIDLRVRYRGSCVPEPQQRARFESHAANGGTGAARMAKTLGGSLWIEAGSGTAGGELRLHLALPCAEPAAA